MSIHGTAAAAYQRILVWIGDGAGLDRARRTLLKRRATAMSVSARGHVGGADYARLRSGGRGEAV